MLPKPTKQKTKVLIEESPKKDEIIALLDLIQEKPWHAVGAVLFVVVCLFAGLVYRAQADAKSKKEAADLLTAMEKEKPEEQLPLLSILAEKNTPLRAEAMYRLGEAALKQKDYAKAKDVFERIHRDFRKSEFAPDAVEALGFVYESLDPPDFEKARLLYEEVMKEWPESYTATWQFWNIGRCYERQNKMAEAVTAYRSQLTYAPASAAAKRAQEALERLRLSHPELFQDENRVVPDVSETSQDSPPSLQSEQIREGNEQPETSSVEAPPELKLTLPQQPDIETSPSDAVDVALPKESATTFPDNIDRPQ